MAALCLSYSRKRKMTPLSVNPSSIVVMSWPEIEATFQPRKVPAFAANNVLLSDDYAIKVLHSTDPHLQNELHVMGKLNDMVGRTLVFGHAYGTIFSPDSPWSSSFSEQQQHGDDIESTATDQGDMCDDNNNDETPSTHLVVGSQHIPGGGHYVYLFMEPIQSNFSDLPDEPQVNEDFFFEVLIALCYARKAFSFCHWDIHPGQLMFNTLHEEQLRCYQIGDNSNDQSKSSNAFYVSIRSHIQPKLVDFGKSVVDETGITTEELMQLHNSGDTTRWRSHPKLWNKSDIYHLALLFSHRENLSVEFRSFLEETVLPMYKSSMYATRPQKDCSTNYANIEELLRLFYNPQ